MQEKSEKKWTNISIKKDIKQRLKLAATKRGLSMAKLLDELVAAYEV